MCIEFELGQPFIPLSSFRSNNDIRSGDVITLRGKYTQLGGRFCIGRLGKGQSDLFPQRKLNLGILVNNVMR